MPVTIIQKIPNESKINKCTDVQKPFTQKPYTPVSGDTRLGAKQTCEYLGLCRATVTRWRNQNIFPPGHYIGSKIFWWRGQLDEFVESGANAKPGGNAANLQKRTD